MPSFDYIASKDLRVSLEADFNELIAGLDGRAWKSVHVIAGSIVEALLVDYLDSTNHTNRPTKNPLSMDLAEAVEICRAEGVITARTADLCSVVRSFRNLIHPGRMVRLHEEQPNEESSRVAVALVTLIANELERFRRHSVGLTAEQVLSKIVRDANAHLIVKHTMSELSDGQRERLLLELIPAAHASAAEDDFDDSSDRLASCYRLILESSSDDIRTKAAAQFVSLVRNGDGRTVLLHGSAFFRPGDLSYISNANRAMIKDNFFAQLPAAHTAESIMLLEGIGGQLEVGDVLKWLDPIIKSYTSSSANSATKGLLRDHVLQVITETKPDVDRAIFRRFDDWIAHFKDKLELPGKATLLQSLKDDAIGEIPF